MPNGIWHCREEERKKGKKKIGLSSSSSRNQDTKKSIAFSEGMWMMIRKILQFFSDKFFRCERKKVSTAEKGVISRKRATKGFMVGRGAFQQPGNKDSGGSHRLSIICPFLWRICGRLKKRTRGERSASRKKVRSPPRQCERVGRKGGGRRSLEREMNGKTFLPLSSKT